MAGEWTPTTPIDHTLISDLPGEDRKLKNNTIAIVEKEHRTLGDGNSGGEHLQGSAISFVLPTASAPTTDPAGTAFVTADLGRLWWDTTISQMKILTGIGPVAWTLLSDHILASANTWAAIQTFSEIPIATKGIVANDTYIEGRNEADDGNVPLIKAGKNVADDAEVAIVPDKTRLASDADPVEDTDLVNKKYSDRALLGRAKALCRFQADGTLVSGSFNVTSVVKDATGIYTITWDTDFANNDYIVLATARASSTLSRVVQVASSTSGTAVINATTGGGGGYVDTACNVVAYGVQ